MLPLIPHRGAVVSSRAVGLLIVAGMVFAATASAGAAANQDSEQQRSDAADEIQISLTAGSCGELEATTLVVLSGNEATNISNGVLWLDAEVAFSMDELLSETHSVTVDARADDTLVNLACTELSGESASGTNVERLTAADNGETLGIVRLESSGDDTANIEVFYVTAAASDTSDDDDDGADIVEDDLDAEDGPSNSEGGV